MSVDWLCHLPAPLRRGLYFGLQRMVGSRIGPVWSQYLGWARLSPEELQARVERKLRATLGGALEHNAYYRELGLQPQPGETAAELLRRFPVLTREIVRAQFASLVADPLRAAVVSPESVSRGRYDWRVVKTGGTTGHPTSVVHDAGGRDWGRATRLFAARLCGQPLGTRYFRLWGSESDLLAVRLSLTLRTQQALLGCVPLNAFRSRPQDLQEHSDTIRRHPAIDCMEAYVDAAVILARHVLQERQAPPRLRSIIATAGTVTPEYRKILEETFKAEVFDKYGSRECCDIACECREHSGLHIHSPNVFVEIVDAAGGPCPPGETGRILVTLLNNPAFPLIRYDIGDLAQPAAPGQCPCGLAWPRLQSLQGRADDLLTTEDGTCITSVFFRHFVGVSLNREIIAEWQLEQTSPNHFIFRCVPAATDGLAENLDKLREVFRQALGRNAVIEMIPVPSIPPSSTGKVRWIVNNCPRSDRPGGTQGFSSP